MGARDWLDVETIQAISKHISAVVTAILAFILVGLLIRVGLHDGLLKQILEWVDGFILVGLVVVLGWKLLTLTARGKGYGSHCLLVS